MSDKSQEEVIGRAVIDPDFRDRLLKDPEGTVKAEGYAVSAEFITQLKDMDTDAAMAAASNLDGAFAQRKAAT